MDHKKAAKHIKLSLIGIVVSVLLIVGVFAALNSLGFISTQATSELSCAYSIASTNGGMFYTTPRICIALPIIDYVLVIILVISLLGLLVNLGIGGKKAPATTP